MQKSSQKISKVAVWGFAFSSLAAMLSGNVFAAGFEKNVLWSGKWVGVGGAAVSGVQGAEALYFNPAGLAGRPGFEVSGNFSPTWGQFKGPTGTSNLVDSTGFKFSPAFGALVNYGITSQWGVGVGAYVGAGTKADYGTVNDFNALIPTFKPEIRSNIYAIEYSIGTGYELIPGLKIGAAWRIVHVSADVGTVYAVAGPSFANAVMNGLSKTAYNGYRLGAQYTSEDKKWGLGLNYRSNVDFTAKGNATITTYGVSGTTAVNDVTVASALPTQIEFGGNYGFDSVRLYLDYVWTNYSHNQSLSIVGGGISGIQLGWNNMSNVRFGAACTAVPDWTFRAGYVFTSQVTPNTLARATFSSPGTGNTVTVGAGKTVMDKALDLDAAFEHSWASGSTTSAQQTIYGDYSSSDWVLHLGATYRL